MLEPRITSSMVTPTMLPLPPRPIPASVPCHSPSVPFLSIPMAKSAVLSSCESPSPTSIVSSMSTPPASYQTQIYTTPITPHTAEIKLEQVQYEHRYQSPQKVLWLCPQAYTYDSDPTSYYSTSSRVDTAATINTMQSDAGTMYHVDQCCAQSGQHYCSNSHSLYPITASHPQ